MNYMDNCRQILREYQAILREKKLNGELSGMGMLMLQGGGLSGEESVGVP